MKKVLCIFLFLTLALTAFSACTANPPDLQNGETESDTKEQAAAPSMLKICEDGKSKYHIICPAGGGSEMTETLTVLQKAIKTASGVTLPFSTDLTTAEEFEILIGATNRPESTVTPALAKNEILICATGSKIVILTGCDELLKTAANLFLSVLQTEDTALTLPEAFSIRKEETIPEKEEVVINMRIASYNIANGRDANYSFGELAQDILDSGASIIGLQEVDQMTKRNGYRDTMKLLSQYTGWKYYVYVPTIPNYQGGQYGIAILSKYPILSSDYVYLPKKDDSEEQRALLHAVIDVDSVEIDFYTTHCQQASILLQLNKINDQLTKKNPYIITGDFNYQKFEDFANIFKNASFANRADHKLITTVNGQAFDNMICSPSVKLDDSYVINTKHSDHYLLVSDITVTVIKEQ